MLLKELIAQGWESLTRNRLRSALTMLGIIWGLVCVVVLLAYGEGLTRTIFQTMGNMSQGILVIYPGQTSKQAGGQRAGRRITFDYSDVEALREEGNLFRAISAESSTEDLSIKLGTRMVAVTVRGVEYPYGRMRKILDMQEGRYFNESEAAEHRRVVIFGNAAAQKVFRGAPAVGASVSIQGQQFEVVGVLKKKVQNSMYSGPDDEHAFIPFDTYQELMQRRNPEIILVQPLSLDLNEQALQQARSILGRRHHFDPKDDKAITAWDTIESQKDSKVFGLAMEAVLGLIGALTLGVGGVGVMNIMLVSVTERTREIGLRKALGARPRDILRQFLLEALVLTFLGGIIGLLLSVAITHAIPPMPLFGALREASDHEGDLYLRASGMVMAISLGVLSIVGIVSGFWPALKAARMNPIEALRYE